MAITDKEQGVWDVDEVYNKINQGVWSYTGASDLYAWGGNNTGQLGQNQSYGKARSSPIQIPGNWDKDKVSFGRYFMTGIKSDGTSWIWGTTENGVLGQNQPTQAGVGISSPIQLPGSWSRLPAGSEATSGIKTDGTLWTWGENSYGVLGLNDANNLQRSSPAQVGTDTDWGNVFIGLYNSAYGVKTDGTLWSWGYGGFGALGQNTNTHKSSPVQVGTDTTWDKDNIRGGNWGGQAIKTDGTLWTWGFNIHGELGQNTQGNPTSRSSPTQLPGTTWSKVTTGTNHSVALKTDGTLWTWGSNSYGALGQNNITYYSSPVQIPGTTWNDVAAAHKAGAARKTDGTLWTWGSADTGMGGRNTAGTPGNVSSPTQIPGTNWTAIIGSITGSRNFAGIKSL